jgi:hypothetical protein
MQKVKAIAFSAIILAWLNPSSVCANPLAAIFKIRSAACADKLDDKRLTGFIAAGKNGILTALHGVVGCQIISAQRPGKDGIVLQNLSIVGADLDHDVALLSGPNEEQLQELGLPVAKESDQPIDLKVWGFPENVLTPLDTNVTIRSVQYSSWYQMTDEARAELQRRKSPNPTVRMLSIEGAITHGHSGAPIVTRHKSAPYRAGDPYRHLPSRVRRHRRDHAARQRGLRCAGQRAGRAPDLASA